MSRLDSEWLMWMRQAEIRLAMLENSIVGFDKFLKSLEADINKISTAVLEDLLRRCK